MAKRKRGPTNKITGSTNGELIKVDAVPYEDAPAAVHIVQSFAVTRSTLFTAEFEAVIEIIARDRVYRMMLDSLRRQLVYVVPEPPELPSIAAD